MDKPNEAAANYELERSARHDAGHTALPWKAKPSAVYESVYAEDGDLICFASMRPNAKANAAFIARACNAHDDLVKALRDLCNAVDSCVDLTPEVMAQARAALFKAQGT